MTVSLSHVQLELTYNFLDTETVRSSFHNAITLPTDTSLVVIYEFRNVS